MALRAQWKGQLRIGEVECAVALYTAASTAERTSFHMVNRKTGNRLRREFVDEDSGKPVDRDDQVKGYETSKGSYVILEPEEIAAAVPEGDKTLAVQHFIACDDVDAVYFDKPYFVAPADDAAEEAFAIMREGMRRKKVAALARAVLFRRVRTILLRPRGCGLAANTLNFDYEVRAADEVFGSIPEVKVEREMLDLARHIINTKAGTFDPAAFDDRYDAALAELVKAKIEGRPVARPKRQSTAKVVDLMEALRASAAATRKPKDRKPARPAPKRKAG